MAQIILSTLGTALAGPVGGAIGSIIGQSVDQAAIASLQPAHQLGPRLGGLRLQGTAEGAPIPAAFGRSRIAGQVIWATRFRERRQKGASSGKGGPRTVDYRYSLSFAIGLCEGPIDGIGRIWADGKALEIDALALRVYRGTEDQHPDPLIMALEGQAPAYRGLAYVVFEDLPLDRFGDRLPQLSFEIFRRPASIGRKALEDRLTSLCLIPGTGEFALATEPVLRRAGLATFTSENVNNAQGRPDLLVALDQLQAHLPAVRAVTLVVAWFGDDLRCGQCQIRPGVDAAQKASLPMVWQVSGCDRQGARLVSQHMGQPAYGGTPADAAVLQAIAALKARGLAVTLAPFLLMDIPQDNRLPDPYGGTMQSAYPWRGRITCDVAPGRPGSPDQTAGMEAQISRLFGTARPDHIVDADGLPIYRGPPEWSLRRMVLHYAGLARLAGGVESFLIGSELVGLTRLRSDRTTYPAVQAFKALAADVRQMIGPDTAIGYAADWTEYFGHQPQDGRGDVIFHLDPLWSDPQIDFVGIDYYPPLTDWQAGDGGLDAVAFSGPHDPTYLAAGVTGGEGFDWYYANQADRAAQRRQPITDGAYGEPWIYRPKDLAGWWGRRHFNRIGGVRTALPTDWQPRSKPIRLIEFGCPAVDRGANAPNLFVDAKSGESALPPFSTGARDDLAQRRALEAVIDRYGQDPMVERLSTWCWDSRPWPDFPQRRSVWSDGVNWPIGHWLNGRAGTAPLADLAAALAARAGVALDTGDVGGTVGGYVVDRPMRLDAAIAPLAYVGRFDLAERGGRPSLIARQGALAATLTSDDLALPDDREAAMVVRRDQKLPPDALAIRFVDGEVDYQTGAITVRAAKSQGGGLAQLDLPITLTPTEADRIGQLELAILTTQPSEVQSYLAPSLAMRLEAGDRVSLPDLGGVWQVQRIDHDEHPSARLGPVEPLPAPLPGTLAGEPAGLTGLAGPPAFQLLDLPPIDTGQTHAGPWVAVMADPWPGYTLTSGPDKMTLDRRLGVTRPAQIGQLLADLPAGPVNRFQPAARLQAQFDGPGPTSQTLNAVLAGANRLALQGPSGEWELLQFLRAEPSGPQLWTLQGLLRGQAGSAPAIGQPTTPAGAVLVLIDESLVQLDLSESERGLPRLWRAEPMRGSSNLGRQDVIFTWQALARRPWRPVQLRSSRLPNGGWQFLWQRQSRFGGDSWDQEPPLTEGQPRFQLQVFDGTHPPVWTLDTALTEAVWTSAQHGQAYPAGRPATTAWRVRQWAEDFGWGAWGTATL